MFAFHSDVSFMCNLHVILNHYTTLEPRHDKTNKVSVRPAKILIRLGIRPV